MVQQVSAKCVVQTIGWDWVMLIAVRLSVLMKVMAFYGEDAAELRLIELALVDLLRQGCSSFYEENFLQPPVVPS